MHSARLFMAVPPGANFPMNHLRMFDAMVHAGWSHRLVAQDTALSRRKRGFEPRWDRQGKQGVFSFLPETPFLLLHIPHFIPHIPEVPRSVVPGVAFPELPSKLGRMSFRFPCLFFSSASYSVEQSPGRITRI